MTTEIDLNPRTQTVRTTRTLRRSGSSHVLTIPPQVIQSLDLVEGDEIEIVGDWGEGEIRLTKA